MSISRTLSVLTVLLVASAAACDSSANNADASRAPSAVSPSITSRSPSAAPDLQAPEELAHGLDVPWGLAFLPGGDALIANTRTRRSVKRGLSHIATPRKAFQQRISTGDRGVSLMRGG